MTSSVELSKRNFKSVETLQLGCRITPNEHEGYHSREDGDADKKKSTQIGNEECTTSELVDKAAKG